MTLCFPKLWSSTVTLIQYTTYKIDPSFSMYQFCFCFCSNICSAEVNELYLEFLTQLNGKIQFTCSAPSDKVIAFKEMHPHLESLKNKVMASQNIIVVRKKSQHVLFFYFHRP